jgi:glycosyltransferase involved in cell wall biosynthesis
VRGAGALDTALGDVPPGSTVLVDGIVGCAAPDVVVRQAARLRIVVVVHLPLADETGLEPSVAAALDASERRTLHAAAAVVATSSATAARLVRRHGLEPSRLVVAPPGVDSAPVASRSTAGGRLVCVASVIPRKGHDVLVEALSRVADLGRTLACVGPLDRDARHAGLVRRQIHAHGLQDRVHLRSPLAGDDLAALYAEADLLVLASRAEPYGMVVTEALARAVPVLATAVDGLPEALGTTPDGGPPGMLVPAGDPAVLAAALRRWLTEPPLRQRLRSAALARRPRLRTWEETTAILAGALGRPGRVA